MMKLKPGLHRRLRLLKWLIPLGLVLFVIFYELGPAHWIHERLGFDSHLLAEVIVFGTIGPGLAFLTLEMFGRWIGERETVDLQASLLASAREKEQEVRQVTDDTIQVLFATSLLITTFKAERPELPPKTMAQIEVTEQSLDEAIRRLRLKVLG
jgi:hypothetical protein